MAATKFTTETNNGNNKKNVSFWALIVVITVLALVLILN